MKIKRILIALTASLVSSLVFSEDEACIYDIFSSSRDCVHKKVVEAEMECSNPLVLPLSVTDPSTIKVSKDTSASDSLRQLVEGAVFVGVVNGKFLYKHKSSGEYFDLTAKEHHKYLPFLPSSSEPKVEAKPVNTRGYVKGVVNEINF